MKRKIVLHVGSGKTGSSSIQRALVKCLANQKTGFTLPALGGLKGNQTFRFAFCDLNETTINIRQKYSHSGGAAEFLQYQEELRGSFCRQIVDSEYVVVSSEFLFLSSMKEVARIHSFLRGCGFDEIHVVMYLRDPARYYLSVAQQALKTQHKMPVPKSFRLNMLAAIANWRSISPDSLSIREFDKAHLLNGNVVSDFDSYLSRLGFKSQLDGDVVSNETLSAEATQVLQEFHARVRNTFKSEEQQQIHVVNARKFIKKNPRGTKPVLKKDIANIIYSRFKDELVCLNAEFGIFSELVGDFEDSTVGLVHDDDYAMYFKDIVVEYNNEIYNTIKQETLL